LKENFKLFIDTVTNIYRIETSVLEKIYPEFLYTEINKNEYFITEGDETKFIAFILNGLFKVSFITTDGNEFIKYFLSSSDVLLGSLTYGEESRVSIQGLQKSIVFKIYYNKFLSLCEKYISLDQMKTHLIQKYWARKEKREIDMLANDAKKNYEIFKKEYSHLEKSLSQYHIAMYLGITPTQLSRIKR
jgi:CRP-like cAMP-binding protein